MTYANFAEFESSMRATGFTDFAVRDYPQATEIPGHRHDFSVTALVVRGEMWLTVGAETRHLMPGDTFQMDQQTEHSERYGSKGATYWAARLFPDGGA